MFFKEKKKEYHFIIKMSFCLKINGMVANNTHLLKRHVTLYLLNHLSIIFFFFLENLMNSPLNSWTRVGSTQIQ